MPGFERWIITRLWLLFGSVQKYSLVRLHGSAVFVRVSQSVALWSCQHASALMPTRQTLPCLSHLTIKAIRMLVKKKKKEKEKKRKTPKIPRQRAQTFVTHQTFPLYLSSSSINKISSLVISVYSLPCKKKKKNPTWMVQAHLAASIRCSRRCIDPPRFTA